MQVYIIMYLHACILYHVMLCKGYVISNFICENIGFVHIVLKEAFVKLLSLCENSKN